MNPISKGAANRKTQETAYPCGIRHLHNPPKMFCHGSLAAAQFPRLEFRGMRITCRRFRLRCVTLDPGNGFRAGLGPAGSARGGSAPAGNHGRSGAHRAAVWTGKTEILSNVRTVIRLLKRQGTAQPSSRAIMPYVPKQASVTGSHSGCGWLARRPITVCVTGLI